MQLHKGATMLQIKTSSADYIRNNLVVQHTWDSSWNSNYNTNKAMIDLLLSHVGLAGPDEERSDFVEKRRHDGYLLLAWLRMLWCVSGALVHYCPYGCCSSFQQSCDKMIFAINGFFLAYRPKILALHRWLGVSQPLCWWAFVVLLQDC